jgi:Protein of unknown function (DUF2510)
MGLFSRSLKEPVQRPVRTINGGVQREPEQPGSLQRRARMFRECVRIIADDPLSAPDALGVPIGDGCGMERLVARIAPLFAKERSLLRWVALRGALTQLYLVALDSETGVVPVSQLETAMGVCEVPSAGTAELVCGVAPEWASRLTEEQRTAATQVYTAVKYRLFDYARYSEMTIDQVNQDRRCWLNDAMALDFIAWSAVALLRTGVAARLPAAPEPDALESPGWYTDPLWGKAQRYWDGADWTERVRTNDGHETTQRLRPEESQPPAMAPQPRPAPQAQAPSSSGPAGPSLDRILAEWTPASPEADLARWREGMARYDDAAVENRAEMRASAELMCAALTHYLRGTDITAGMPGTSGELVQTIWNVMVASLLGNDQTTWDEQVERHMRLALAAARHAGLQPESLGGRGTFNDMFDDKGNQMLMLAALWEMSVSGPKAFTLADWFASAPEERAWKVP